MNKLHNFESFRFRCKHFIAVNNNCSESLHIFLVFSHSWWLSTMGGATPSRYVEYWEPVEGLCRRQSREDMELLEAEKRGDRRIMDRWMKREAHVNTWNADGRTPLMVAALEGHAQCAEQLIHRWDADINVLRRIRRKRTYYYPCGKVWERTIPWREIKHGETALKCATENGHYQCLDVLLVAELMWMILTRTV